MVLMDDVLFVARTVYFFLAAYLANAAPVIFGGGAPLDGGRLFLDHRPIFGDHKTVRGTVSGLVVGSVTGLVQGDPLRGVLLSCGALGGDLLASFLKRRLNLKPGAPFPVVDQLSFVLGAVALVSLVSPVPSGEMVVTIVVATLPIHFLSNFFAFLLKLKDKPW
jgi:CDP-2,3-bis-(O-geranylgeranyl)-sn-glycerol synthase